MPASPGCQASTPTRLGTTMSRIFRSDEVQPGDRVVLRRIAPEMEDKFSDIIGHIVSVTPTETVIRPQDIGGMPSFKDGIVVPAADIKIVKKLSPRTIRNSDIRKLEVAHFRVSNTGRWASGCCVPGMALPNDRIRRRRWGHQPCSIRCRWRRFTSFIPAMGCRRWC